MVTNVAYELQTSKALIIGFDTPAILQISCEPLENLVAIRAAQHSGSGLVVGPASQVGLSECFMPFRWLVLPTNR